MQRSLCDANARSSQALKSLWRQGCAESRDGLAADRRLRFFERSVVPIVGRRANGGRRMEWARILAYITGTVDQDSARGRLPPCRTTSWHGTEGSSPASSMARGHVEPRAGHGSTEKLSN